MKHLEIHALQSVPVSCLNRDDLNSPKTAIFGGVQRARVSSQSWKRAIRETAKETSKLFEGKRTRLIIEPLKNDLKDLGIEEEAAGNTAVEIADAIAKKDTDKKVKTLFFTSYSEIKKMAQIYNETKDIKKVLKSLSEKNLTDIADIALFGRMVANDANLNIEGASMFSHAISTHKADNEIDFFTAVDDLQNDEESGAGMMGTLEFNSATYYRFAALNLDQLKTNLAAMTPEQRKEVVSTFIKATLTAMPNARKNSMNGNTLPGYVLFVLREKGHPVQLVNAFENPIKAFGGKSIFERSVEEIKKEYEKLKSTWGLEAKLEKALPEAGLTEILNEIMKHVD
ncbi:MAG TPA: type I-E CRISPR-associated protein Cas7/Cse4/CasC [Spirochaetia bacterium]|nr:type I-E CRISPR-associated protein Cas7/Cse4/CasC [Spirochaetia bacterium]